MAGSTRSSLDGGKFQEAQLGFDVGNVAHSARGVARPVVIHDGRIAPSGVKTSRFQEHI